MMRKLLLALFFVGTTTTIFAQDELNLTLSGGVPMGTKVKDVSNMAFEADINYLFSVSDHVKLGPSVSFLYFNAKEKAESLMFFPMGGTIKFTSSNDDFYVGTDVGAVFPITDESGKGGVYLKPYIGYNVSDAFKVALSYSAVEVKGDHDSGYIGLNLTYNFL